MDESVADVVLGALVDEGRVLLVHRSPDKRAHPDVWDLPGGCVEEGESELGALARELHEELAIHMDPDAVSHLYRLTAGPAEEPALVSAWLVHRWEGTPLNNAPEEHVDIGWFRLDALPSPAHPAMRAALLTALGNTRPQPGDLSRATDHPAAAHPAAPAPLRTPRSPPAPGHERPASQGSG